MSQPTPLKIRARDLYLRGSSVAEIAARLGAKKNTIYYWLGEFGLRKRKVCDLCNGVRPKGAAFHHFEKVHHDGHTMKIRFLFCSQAHLDEWVEGCEEEMG